MRKDYEKQILNYNIGNLNLIIRDDLDIFSSTKILTQIDKNAVLQINLVNDAKKLREELM